MTQSKQERHSALRLAGYDAAVATDPLHTLLEQAFPEAVELSVVDRTGGGDHFQVTVTSPRFEGLTLVDQHKLVYAALGDQLGDHAVHALGLRTSIPTS